MRASPQQLRPASLREHHALPRDVSGRIVPEQIRSNCRNFVQLEGIPEDQDLDGDPINEPPGLSNAHSDLPSQPEGENFPSECPTSISPSPSLAGDREEPEKLVVPEEVPIPDDDIWFVDDVETEKGSDGYWEIGFSNGPHHEVEEICFCENHEIIEWANLATGARKQRVEVQWKSLSAPEQKLFQAAKEKEIKA